MIPRKILWIVGLFCLALFIFFSFLVYSNLFTAFDFSTTLQLQNHISRKFDELFSLFSLMGSVEIASIVLLMVVVSRRKMGGIIVLFLYGVIHLFELSGKLFLDHPKPPLSLLRTDMHLSLPQWYSEPGSSYPSGHAGRATFISLIVLFFALRSKKLSKAQKISIVIALTCYDLFMYVSRVYLGEHWTSDVIGGILLGAALACFAELAY